MSAFRAVIDFTKQWIFFTKTGNEVTSRGSEAEKNRHPVRNITDTPYVPLDAVTLQGLYLTNYILARKIQPPNVDK